MRHTRLTADERAWGALVLLACLAQEEIAVSKVLRGRDWDVWNAQECSRDGLAEDTDRTMVIKHSQNALARPWLSWHPL